MEEADPGIEMLPALDILSTNMDDENLELQETAVNMMLERISLSLGDEQCTDTLLSFLDRLHGGDPSEETIQAVHAWAERFLENSDFRQEGCEEDQNNMDMCDETDRQM